MRFICFLLLSYYRISYVLGREWGHGVTGLVVLMCNACEAYNERRKKNSIISLYKTHL
jgi:hypothetical protein